MSIIHRHTTHDTTKMSSDTICFQHVIDALHQSG